MAIGPNGVGLVLPVALAVAFAGVGAPVAAASCVLSEPQRGTVAQIIDGETLALTDGTIVRLIGAAWLAGRRSLAHGGGGETGA